MNKSLAILFPVISGAIVLLAVFTTVYLFNNSSSPDADRPDPRQSNPTPIIQLTLPKIDRYPLPADYTSLCNAPSWGGIFPSFVNSSPFEIDARSCNLASFDLADREEELLYTTFDSLTVWPTPLPGKFNPRTIMTFGKPALGLNISHLHEQGITGKNVGIAVIDQALLVNHTEYARNIQLYEEYEETRNLGPFATMHGGAVASIAVGNTVGVAPDADLYFIASLTISENASGGLEKDFTYYAKAVERIVEINEHLSTDKKIRVLAIPVAWLPRHKGYQAMENAVQKALEQNIFVVSSNMADSWHFMGLGRSPQNNPNHSASYEPGLWWRENIYGANSGDWLAIYQSISHLFVPMDSLTTASPTGASDYVFYRGGGISWSIPFIAGLYALACEVNPDITPQHFWMRALATGDPLIVEVKGAQQALRTIVNPFRLIEALNKDQDVSGG